MVLKCVVLIALDEEVIEYETSSCIIGNNCKYEKYLWSYSKIDIKDDIFYQESQIQNLEVLHRYTNWDKDINCYQAFIKENFNWWRRIQWSP